MTADVTAEQIGCVSWSVVDLGRL